MTASSDGSSDAAFSGKIARKAPTWIAPHESVTGTYQRHDLLPKASPQLTAPDGGGGARAPAADGGRSPPATADEAPTPPPARLLAYSAPSEAASEPMPDDFSVSEVRELYIYSVHAALLGEHRELRRFYAPNGDLYYEKLVAFSTELTEPAPFLDALTTAHSTQVAAVRPERDGRLVIADHFPVAGTWISDRAMTGTWRLELFLDDAKKPTATLPLELVP